VQFRTLGPSKTCYLDSMERVLFGIRPDFGQPETEQHPGVVPNTTLPNLSTGCMQELLMKNGGAAGRTAEFDFSAVSGTFLAHPV